ncbi:MAG TPA: DEAD/DEAH box helicase [Planctomicrobium sp.]|nr:DEAD/DEAH box helicase [Planctomicrobium sp.]
MEFFATCHKINDLLNSGKDGLARDELIKLLGEAQDTGRQYSPLLNSLIRGVGLFPYLDTKTSSWEERYIHELFKADIGEGEPVTLHREQARLLNDLLSGESIAVSAPTSFGKSFVIDSFIAIKKPNTVVILVPTIALADETRRRLQSKFGETYKIVTAPDQSLAIHTILIFPQERSIGYISRLKHIDMLIVDEFYKASSSFDKDRSPSLVRAILALSRLASQRYFLAPNISNLNENPFTKGMKFLRLDFNTVFLEKTDLSDVTGKDEEKKSEALLSILEANSGKTLIYAGTFSNIVKLSNLLMSNLQPVKSGLLQQFQSWLSSNYDANWSLPTLAAKGIGIHNGRIHRSLGQIQIRLFEIPDGLSRMVSTSSIIEGVNTSAKNIVLWSNRNGSAKINDFTYKNIIGRGGRMFRHFVGKVFILDPPPADEDTRLELDLPDELLGAFDKEVSGVDLSQEQAAKISQYKSEISQLIGDIDQDNLFNNTLFQTSSSTLLLRIATEVRNQGSKLRSLLFLNSDDTKNWDSGLYSLVDIQRGGWGIEHSKYVAFVKIIANNWKLTIPELLDQLDVYDIGVDQFFELERNTAFKLSAILSDVSTVYNLMHPDSPIELSKAISKLSHVFLPTVVYQLEEYGLPRMISRKITNSNALNLSDPTVDIHEVIQQFRRLGMDALLRRVGDLDQFDIFIVRYFYEGIGAGSVQSRDGL